MQVFSVSTTLIICYLFFSVSGKLCPTKTYSLLDTVSNDHIICPRPGEPSHYTECCGTVSSRRCCPGNNRLFDEDRKKRVGRQDFYGGGNDDLFDVFDEDSRHRAFDDEAEMIEGGRHLLSAERLRPTAQARIGRSSSVGKFVAIIIGVVVFIFVGTLLCCCCIPCCFCAKKRNLNRGGIVHSQATGPAPPQSGVQTSYSGPSQYPTQQHGPGQYPLQQQVPSPAQMPPYSDLPPPYPGPPVHMSGPGYPPQMMSEGPGYPQMSGGQAPGYGVQSTVPEYAEKQPVFNPNMQQ